MYSEASVEIDRNIDEVFVLTNEHVEEWSIVVVEDKPIDEPPTRVGSRFESITEDRGHRMVFSGEVIKYEPPRVSAIRMTGASFDIEAEYRFEDLQGRTRVTQRSYVDGKGLNRMFFMLFGWAMKKSSCDAVQRELESLKAYCEGFDGEIQVA